MDTTATRELSDTAAYAPLGQSIREEFNYRPVVSGQLPHRLRGTLYRNGPGLFERGGRRKRHLLDGDGLVQAFHLADGHAEYRARFVRTAKFVEESAAGSYCNPTWTTRSARGLFGNSLARIKTQAGVAVVAKGGRVFALDDTGLPYEIDAETLATRGAWQPGPAAAFSTFNAHTRYDSSTGDTLLFGQQHGRQYKLHVLTVDRRLRERSHFSVVAPRGTYLHDWFATPNYVVFNCHALAFRPLAGLLGLKAFTECLEWQPALGNTVLVVDRRSGAIVVQAEAPAAFMWHSANAFEAGNTLVADFVGYDEPDHFIGTAPAFETIMSGAPGRFNAAGTLRRYTINLSSGALTESVIDAGHFEFPMIDMRDAGQRTRYAWLAEAATGHGWQDSVVRIDLDSGAKSSYRFDGPCQVGEPVFVADPDAADGRGCGWILSVVFNTRTQCSALAVLKSEALADGPVALVELDHATPLSFHGTWMAARGAA